MCNECVKILLDKKDERKWEEQKLDWTLDICEVDEYLIYDDHFKTVVKLTTMPDRALNCICGVKILNNYLVFNKKRRICALLGSVCICKHKIDEKPDNGAFNGNNIIEQQMIDLHKYHCDICNKTMSKDNQYKHEISQLHKKKYKMKHYRLCKSCKTYSIDKNKPNHFYMCTNCYKSKKTLQEQMEKQLP